jgi:hypothetical protein
MSYKINRNKLFSSSWSTFTYWTHNFYFLHIVMILNYMIDKFIVITFLYLANGAIINILKKQFIWFFVFTKYIFLWLLDFRCVQNYLFLIFIVRWKSLKIIERIWIITFFHFLFHFIFLFFFFWCCYIF